MKCKDCALHRDCQAVMEANGKKLDLEKDRQCWNYTDEMRDSILNPKANSRANGVRG